MMPCSRPVLPECSHDGCANQEVNRFGKYIGRIVVVGGACGAYLVCQGLNESVQAIEAVASPFQRVHVVRDVGVHLLCQLCAYPHCSSQLNWVSPSLSRLTGYPDALQQLSILGRYRHDCDPLCQRKQSEYRGTALLTKDKRTCTDAQRRVMQLARVNASC